MKVSIITVVRNNKECIKDAIESVLNQTYKDIEYIIIDGASSDGTVEIVQSYKDKISKFISESDRGLYDASEEASMAYEDARATDLRSSLNSDTSPCGS